MSKNTNSVVFCPNSGGKTVFADAMPNIKTDDRWVSINRRDEKRLIVATYDWEKVETTHTGEEFLDLRLNLKTKNPFLKKEDIKNLNKYLFFFDVQIVQTNETQIIDLKFKKGRQRSKTVDIKFVSSSEHEFIKGAVFLLGYVNSKFNLIIDDPVELASWQNENFYVSLFEKTCKSKNKKIFLTHRHSLFEKVLTAQKNCKNITFYVFIDNCFLTVDVSGYRQKNIFQKMFEGRIAFEAIKHFAKNSDDALLSFLYQKSQTKYNAISSEKEKLLTEAYSIFNNWNTQNNDFFEYIKMKFSFLFILREAIIDSFQKNIQSLNLWKENKRMTLRKTMEEKKWNELGLSTDDKEMKNLFLMSVNSPLHFNEN